MDLEIAQKQVSEYAMAFDLLAKVTQSITEKEAIENILQICSTLFSPQKLFFYSIKEGQLGQIYSLFSLTEDKSTIKTRLSNFSKKYDWTESKKGFQIQINYQGNALGILEVDELACPEYKEHYLNLTISMADVYGLAIENAMRYQRIKAAEKEARQKKAKLEKEISERKQMEEQLLEKEETLKIITESTNDAIIIMNNRGIITFWNTAASNMLRYSKEEALGENLHELIVPERFLNAHLSAFPQFIKTGKGNAIGTTLELYAIGKNHIEIPIELSLSSIMVEGEWFAVGIMRDNTERKKMEEELRRLATIDSLTNINNRRYFLDLALKEMERSKRYGHPFSLIMLDIDHFKKVNDTYGHSVGDQVLIDFCDTCMKELRESDFMGRLGGEEFAVAIVESDLEGAANLAERIRGAVASHTVVIGNEEIRFTVSIGITQMWQDSDLNSMLESADNALYKAKNNGRNQVQFAEIKPV